MLSTWKKNDVENNQLTALPVFYDVLRALAGTALAHIHPPKLLEHQHQVRMLVWFWSVQPQGTIEGIGDARDVSEDRGS